MYLYVISGGFACAWQSKATSSPSLSASPSGTRVTWGAYSTSRRMEADCGMGSAEFCAWQVRLVLWSSLRAVRASVEILVSRFVFSTFSFLEDTPESFVFPSPSSQVIWKHKERGRRTEKTR